MKNKGNQFRLARKGVVWGSRLLRGIDPWKVVFSAFQGRSYGDNPRCISERLHDRCPKAKIVWLLRPGALDKPGVTLPDYVTAVGYSSPRAYAELGTARVWVDNFTKNNLLRHVRGRQFYVQTWHGDRPVKKICYDMEEGGGPYRIEERCDRVLTGSKFGERMFRTAFRYKGRYIAAGAPRNDILIRGNPADAQRVRAALGVPGDVKLMLYAPTYREDTDVIPREAHMDMARTLACLERVTGDRWMCLFRAHYLSSGIDLEAVKDRVVDVTQYPEMADLLLAADLLITDYSSCATDFILQDRPALFYIPDWAHFKTTRPVYYDMKDAPFMTASTQSELEALIAGLTEARVVGNCEAIRAYFGTTETGGATDAACDYIISRLGSRRRLDD